jgi:hypothetical protein
VLASELAQLDVDLPYVLIDGVKHSRVLRSRGTYMRIPVHADHRFRCKPITDSSPSRSLIPVEPDHRFRCQADHFLAATGIVH